jgi:hypothetical protein
MHLQHQLHLQPHQRQRLKLRNNFSNSNEAAVRRGFFMCDVDQ